MCADVPRGAPDPDEAASDIESLRRDLSQTDPAVVIANHCYGLFELAAVHLAAQPPQLPEAQLAIDALAGIVESLGDRLGTDAASLNEGLAQLRLAWVQLQAVAEAADSTERSEP